MVSFGKLAAQAKRLVDQRGGMDSVKQDLGELRDIAKSPGSAQDKVKQAGQALRKPGAHTDGSAPGTEHTANGTAPEADQA
jgi:hypothetical protein